MKRLVAVLQRAPLRVKLAGADALLLVVGLGVLVVPALRGQRLEITLALFAAAVALNALLVTLALGPVAAIEDVASAVTRGDYECRVPELPLADPSVARVGHAVNRLLDHVAAERRVVGALAGEVARSRETERTALAHELREGVAQTLYALTLELGHVEQKLPQRTAPEHLPAKRARTASTLAAAALTDVQRIVGGLSPGSLGILGVTPALKALARRVSQRDGLPVTVDVDATSDSVAEPQALLLYRVAEHALQNARLHRKAASASIRLSTAHGRTRLEVGDDGSAPAGGIDDPIRAEPGLFGLREAIILAGGQLRFEPAGTRGTRVVAELPG